MVRCDALIPGGDQNLVRSFHRVEVRRFSSTFDVGGYRCPIGTINNRNHKPNGLLEGGACAIGRLMDPIDDKTLSGDHVDHRIIAEPHLLEISVKCRFGKLNQLRGPIGVDPLEVTPSKINETRLYQRS